MPQTLQAYGRSICTNLKVIRRKVDELMVSAVIVDGQDRASGVRRVRDWSVALARGLRVFGWFVFVVVQVRGLTTSIYGYHSLRQTQTAISIREMLRGGPLLRYETPIFGPPWSIPLEFPTYQWICAGGVKLFGTSIDGTSRVVSSIFGAGCVIVLTRIHRVLERPELERHLLEAMAVLSPLLLFWSHTVLIETCSVFLALVWLEFALRWVLRPGEKRMGMLFGAVVFGFFAGATKGTSVFPALIFFGVFVAARLVRVARRRQLPRVQPTRRQFLVELFGVGIAVLAPIAATGWWTRTAETTRLRNPRGPGEIRRQIFGTWAERTEFGVFGRATVRTVGHSIGSTWVAVGVGVAVVAACLRFRRPASVSQADSAMTLSSTVLALASMAAFVVTPLALFHVHVIHDYYSVEILPYLILSVVFGFSVIRERLPSSSVALANLVIPTVVVVLSLTTYARFYGPKDAEQMAYHPAMRAAVERSFGPDDVIVVRNTGYDPSIGYHVARKIVTQSESDDIVELNAELRRLDAAG
jgi:hypothetical protein